VVGVSEASGGAGKTPGMVGMGSKTKWRGKGTSMGLGSLWVGEVKSSNRSWRGMWDRRSSRWEEEVESKRAKTAKMIHSERDEGDFVFVDRVDKSRGSGSRGRATLEFRATACQVSPRD
jgi:hypothetical protein